MEDGLMFANQVVGWQQVCMRKGLRDDISMEVDCGGASRVSSPGGNNRCQRQSGL